MNHLKYKAILFDSGKVLNSSASGHWFISPNFWKYVDESKFKKISAKKINHAFYEAQSYIMSIPLITTKEDEYMHFIKFYEILASFLLDLNIKQEQIEFLAKDIVYNSSKYVFYEDALSVLSKLRGYYKFAIISDAWPSLIDVYKDNGLYTYFDSFVISSMIGVTKPDKKMYLTALEELHITAEDAVFVDDNVTNCIGAMKLGIHGILLCRNR